MVDKKIILSNEHDKYKWYNIHNTTYIYKPYHENMIKIFAKYIPIY